MNDKLEQIKMFVDVTVWDDGEYKGKQLKDSFDYLLETIEQLQKENEQLKKTPLQNLGKNLEIIRNYTKELTDDVPEHVKNYGKHQRSYESNGKSK